VKGPGPDRRRLAVVSNRGPIGFARSASGEREVRRGSGGLVSALSGLVRAHDVIWTASALSDEDRLVAEERHGRAVAERTAAGDELLLRLVAPDPEDQQLAYGTLANPLLWFVHHGIGDPAALVADHEALKRAWRAYGRVNGLLARAAAQDHGAVDAVLVHDYHLDLAPALLRAASIDAPILHFTHIPWPAPEAWAILPEPMRSDLLHGLLGADIIGLHTPGDVESFLRTCATHLEDVRIDGEHVVTDGRRTAVRAYPISVSPAEIRSHVADPASRAAYAELAVYDNLQVILRVDRTDPSKNIVRGFEAYGRLLERRPDLHGRIVFLALLHPSRQEIREYADLVADIHAAVGGINERFGHDGWLPIDLRIGDNFPGTVAAYRRYDVLLVNPIADGMNLVSKEAPLVNERDGVLVLSERAGAFDELGADALTIDPLDVEATATRLEEALALPGDERRRRSEAIRRQVERHDVDHWIGRQLDDLTALRGGTRT
jgi:trehalose 6-phosphate synthase